jgi:hypothetical protein
MALALRCLRRNAELVFFVEMSSTLAAARPECAVAQHWLYQ